VEIGAYSSKHHATKSGDSAAEAKTSETNAKTSEDKSKAWASQATGEVEPGLKSSKQYAEDSQASADAAATSAASINLPTIAVGDANKTLKLKADESGYELIDAAALRAMVDSIPIGGYVTVQGDLVGAGVPDQDRYIRLVSGLAGVGGYNEGKLTTESVSGISPLINATAVISDPESPLDGQTVRLLETEERFLRAGNPGQMQDSQLELHSHGMGSMAAEYADGAYTRMLGSASNGVQSTTAGSTGNFGSETRPRNIGVAVYMRIK
jgi:hypothetical protein